MESPEEEGPNQRRVSPQTLNASDHAGLQSCGLGHHVLGPRRVENQFYFDAGYAVKLTDFVPDLRGQDIAHATARRGQRHRDDHGPRAVVQVLDFALVDQPQINDVDGNFRVVAGLEPFLDQLFQLLFAGAVIARILFLDFLAQRVRIRTVNAKQIALEIDCVTVPQCLGDTDFRAFLDDHMCPLRDERGIALPGEFYGFLIRLWHAPLARFDFVM